MTKKETKDKRKKGDGVPMTPEQWEKATKDSATGSDCTVTDDAPDKLAERVIKKLK